MPLAPSRIRIGKRTRDSETVRSIRCGLSLKPGAKSGMTTGAAMTKIAVSAPITIVIRSSRVEARRKASLNWRLPTRSVKTGTKAGCRAASANRARTRLGTWKAIVKAEIGPATPK